MASGGRSYARKHCVQFTKVNCPDKVSWQNAIPLIPTSEKIRLWILITLMQCKIVIMTRWKSICSFFPKRNLIILNKPINWPVYFYNNEKEILLLLWLYLPKCSLKPGSILVIRRVHILLSVSVLQAYFIFWGYSHKFIFWWSSVNQRDTQD